MVDGRLVGGSVVRGFNKNQEKNMFGVVISPDFIFFYIDDKEKTNLIARSSHSNLLFLKIHKYYNFK